MRDGLPGSIVFHRPRITVFLKATVDFIESTGLKAAMRQRELCEMLVWGIYAHEQFHCLCDVQRNLAKSKDQTTPLERLREEGLATAWEWRSIRAYGRQADVPSSLVSAAIHWWFDSMESAGYRDWKNYVHRCDFLAAARQYIAPASALVRRTDRTHEWQPVPKAAQVLNDAWRALCTVAPWCYYTIIHGECLEGQAPVGWPGHSSTVSLKMVTAALSLLDDIDVSPPKSLITIDKSGRKLTEIPEIAETQRTPDHLLCLADNHIETLHDCHKSRKRSPAKVCLRGNHLKECLAGLLLMEGLEEVQMDLEGISSIINRHKRNLENFDQHLCAEDIGQAGYEDLLEL